MPCHLYALCLKINKINIVKQFLNPLKAFEWLQNNNVDLIISDIEMPDINGIEIIKNLKHQPKVIFTSNYPQFAIKSFDVKPIHYLLKPITFNQLINAINRFEPNNANTKQKAIYITQNQEHIKLLLNNIKYIKSEGNFVKVFTNDNKYLVLSNLTQFTKQLPGNDFMRVHKSFTVNINQINKYTFEHLIIDSDIIPVGESYRPDFLELMDKMVIKRKP